MVPLFREVILVIMKRKHIHLTREDKYGHWWFEIGDPLDPESESYGWWPLSPVGRKQAVRGVQGELNGQTNFLGLPNRDPHHGDDADESFHPVVLATNSRSDIEIADCLRRFAQAYNGGWRWTFGKG